MLSLHLKSNREIAIIQCENKIKFIVLNLERFGNNISCVIPQVGSGEGGMYATLSLPCECREAILDRPLGQVKQIEI